MIHRWLHDLSRIFFPECCPVCHQALVDGEELLCMECHWKIPRTQYHLSSENQLLHKLVSLNVPIEKAASYFFYKKDNPYSLLIQQAKYNHQPIIDRELAAHFARELKIDGFFDDIDVIIPVPIHWTKYLRRGYNQTDYIAQGLNDITGIPVAVNLRAVKSHKTQTRKSGKERRKSLSNVFHVDKPAELQNSHILLVDDVITTGSTILACAETVKTAVPTARISILSLATTKLG
jgi:ComF family protein